MNTSGAQRLALGTAQFGSPYGITNGAGRLDDTAIRELLAGWRGFGHTLIDTAGGYGDSEARLGSALAFESANYPWQVMTKTPAARADRFTGEHLASFQAAWAVSRQRLGSNTVHALLVHHADDLLIPGAETLHGWLLELRARAEVARIGVSVYDAAQIEALFNRYAANERPFDIVQLPASIADQRLLAHPVLRSLRGMGVRIDARSLYLQGLLLAPPEFVEQRFPGKGRWVRRFQEYCAAKGLTPVQACMSFFRSNPLLDTAVVGLTSVAELREIQSGFDTAPVLDWQSWADNDPLWVDPRHWSRS